MKRLLLVVVVAAAMLGLLAAPALASSQQPQPGNAYVDPFSGDSAGNAWWWDGGTQEWQVPGTTIPTSDAVWVTFNEIFVPRGTALNVPNWDLYALSVAKDGAPYYSISGAASQAVWSPVYLFAMGPTFNKASATWWARDWWLDLGKLAPGSYACVLTETVRHPVNDLGLYYEGQQRPYKINAGTSTYAFSFTVAP